MSSDPYNNLLQKLHAANEAYLAATESVRKAYALVEAPANKARYDAVEKAYAECKDSHDELQRRISEANLVYATAIQKVTDDYIAVDSKAIVVRRDAIESAYNEYKNAITQK